MNYRSKRNARGLSVYTVSSRLGIDYNTYLDVEHGKRNLEKERIDKFMEILDNSVEIKLEHIAKMTKVNEWFESGESRKALESFGYTTKSLAKKLGVAQSHISNVFCGRYKSEDIRERIYDFLTDNLNIQIDEKEHNKIEKIVKVNKMTNDVNKETEKVVEEDELIRLRTENQRLNEIVNAFVKLANKL